MKRLKILSAFFGILLAASCSSVKDPKNIYSDIDYTQEDARKEEIKRIEELLEKNPVQALWRSTLLADEEMLQKAFLTVRNDFDKALEKNDFFNARRLYNSLEVASYPELKNLSKNKSELEKLVMEKVPGLSQKPSAESLKKVSQLINGTVTIWVDKGIKVEKGMGYADRVIGSGFFISKDGYVITNNHVIEDIVDKKSSNYSRLYIKLAEDSDTRIPAKVIGWDPEIDLALLKAEVEAPYVFALGSSSDLDIGDKIYAIGSPVGLERTLTSGIVSADDRKLFTLASVLQIDAAVNSGNSGGPCIDENGNVQAIVFAGMLQFEGLNFAIPVEYLKSLLPALYAGGKIEHPWFGCFGRTKKEFGKNTGLEVLYCMPGGSASRAKIKAGDVIVELNGQKVTTLEEFQNAMMKIPAKEIAAVKYQTEDGKVEEKSIYLSVRPEQPGYSIYKSDIFANSAYPIFGMKLKTVSASSSRKYCIEKLVPGSIAYEYGFSENDPVEILNVKTNDKNTAIYAEVYTKNQKKGYLDVSMAFSAGLDCPYYF